jgi:hypothetical protein
MKIQETEAFKAAMEKGHLVEDPNTQVMFHLTYMTLIDMEERLDFLTDRLKEANRLIAHNMMAIVRLEVASSCDAITNTIIEIKREITGSGSAQLAVNFTATLVMIAGNVLTGGGMTVLGAVLVAGGGVLMEASKSDALGMLRKAIPMTTAAVAGSRDGNLTSESFSLRKDSGPYSSDSADKKSGNVINSGAEGVGNLYDTLMPSAQGTSSVAGSYEPKKKRTLFIKHGAGGTAAITDDVQTAIVKAYYDVCNTLSNETSMVRDPTKPAAGSLLKEIVDAVVPPQGATTSLDGLKLHPLTKRVLCNALNELKGGGGQRYQDAIRAEGSTKGNKAILAVKDAYRIMSESLETDAGLPTAADLKGNSVISNHFKSGWF